MEPGELQVETRRGHRMPFSKGLITESLSRAGVDPEVAQGLAHRLEAELRERGRFVVSSGEVKETLSRWLRELGQEEAAERFLKQTQAFEEIVVEDEEGARPFSKGVLARSLEDAGFDLPEAYELAKKVEAKLRERGVRRIQGRDLEALVAETIAESRGRQAAARYRERTAFLGTVFVAEPEGEPRVPFSKGILAQSMMSAGLPPERAYRIAREVERQLLERGERMIRRDELRDLVYRRLQREAGEEIARRYLLLRMARRLERPIHILIGGVTGVGKSALASALAWRLGITRMISSDSVREILRATVPKDLVPTLHVSTFEAWRYLAQNEVPKEPRPEDVIRGYLDQVARVAVGLRAIQDRSAREATPIVMEGVHVIPTHLPHKAEVIQVPMIVVLEDEEVHRSRFLLRERETRHRRRRERYLRHFREIRWMQEYLIDLAREAGIPVIPGEDHDKAVEKGLEVLVERVAAVQPLSEAFR